VATTPDPRQLRADADHVLELHEAGRYDEALDACDEVVAAATDLDHPVVRQSAFVARFERALILAELGELEDAADAAITAARVLPFDRDDPDQTHELAMLLVHGGTCHAALGDPAAALGVYDDLVAELGDARDPVTREQLIRGRVNRAVALLDLERTEDALAAGDALASELDADDPVLAEQLGMVHRLRASALRELGRPADAVVALEAVAALAEVPVGGARAQAAAAEGERAALLAELGQPHEAIARLDEAVDRLAGDPDIEPVVADLRRVEADLLEATGQHERAAALRATG
jgi:tetratricopeptide (TPR) repeat protein